MDAGSRRGSVSGSDRLHHPRSCCHGNQFSDGTVRTVRTPRPLKNSRKKDAKRKKNELLWGKVLFSRDVFSLLEKCFWLNCIFCVRKYFLCLCTLRSVFDKQYLYVFSCRRNTRTHVWWHWRHTYGFLSRLLFFCGCCNVFVRAAVCGLSIRWLLTEASCAQSEAGFRQGETWHTRVLSHHAAPAHRF